MFADSGSLPQSGASNSQPSKRLSREAMVRRRLNFPQRVQVPFDRSYGVRRIPAGPFPSSPAGRSTTLRVDHAEEVPFRVREDQEVFTRLAGPVPGGTEAKQPFDLPFLVFCVKVEMQSAPLGLPLVNRYVGPFSNRVPQDYKGVSRSWRFPWSVTKRLLPERHHSGKVVAVDYNGPDPHGVLRHDAHDSAIRR